MTDAKPVRGRRIPTTAVEGWMDPMLATLVDAAPDKGSWVYERKLDGIRALAHKKRGGVRLYSRNKLPLDESFPSIVQAVERLGNDLLVLDGEVVATRNGKPAGFEALQQRGGGLRYYVFDVLSVDGEDLRLLPFTERRARLKQLRLTGTVRATTLERGDPEALLEDACAQGWEGLIAKRADAAYMAGRSRDWLKLKCVLEQEFVVGGFTDPKGSRAGFGALLVGVYDGTGLRFAGEVGTGFNTKTLTELAARLTAMETDRSPFADHARARKGQHFVKPSLVAQVGFSEWTRDGKLRHPRFLGLRTDKRPRDVVRENPS